MNVYRVTLSRGYDDSRMYHYGPVECLDGVLAEGLERVIDSVWCEDNDTQVCFVAASGADEAVVVALK